MKTSSKIKIFVLGSMLFSMTQFANAQQADYYNQDAKSALKFMEKFAGTWEGVALNYNRTTYGWDTIQQKEEVSFILDSTVLRIHGFGEMKGKVVHDAFALLSHEKEDQFNFYSAVGDGKTGLFKGYRDGEKFIWEMKIETGTIRFTLELVNGVWKEIGEFNYGGNWTTFFMMDLKKVEEA